MNSRVGDLLSEVIEGTITGDERMETASTEDAIVGIEVAREKVKMSEKKVVIGIGDVVGLYPACKARESARAEPSSI